MRIVIAIELETLVRQRVPSSCLRARLLGLLWIASTYSGEVASRAYTIAVRAMEKRGVASEEEIAGIVDAVYEQRRRAELEAGST